MTPDLASIAIVVDYVQDRLGKLPWLLADKRPDTEHRNSLVLSYRREPPQVVPKKSWFHAGFVTVDWTDPMTIHCVGPHGSAEFSVYDPDALDKIVQFLEEKYNGKMRTPDLERVEIHG
jgi:hypothetical protein